VNPLDSELPPPTAPAFPPPPPMPPTGAAGDSAPSGAAGVSKARYRITKDRVWIESGLLGTRTESVPLWSIKDMDVRQAVWQRGNDIGDVVLNIEGPYAVLDIPGMAGAAFGAPPQVPAAPPPAGPQPDLAAQKTKLLGG
jgi:hypothetical protein